MLTPKQHEKRFLSTGFLSDHTYRRSGGWIVEANRQKGHDFYRHTFFTEPDKKLTEKIREAAAQFSDFWGRKVCSSIGV